MAVVWHQKKISNILGKQHYFSIPKTSSVNLDITLITIKNSRPGFSGEDDKTFIRILMDESIEQADESLFLANSVLEITFDGMTVLCSTL